MCVINNAANRKPANHGYNAQGETLCFASFVNGKKNFPMLSYNYHRLTRANTPASVSFRRFLPFSSWRAPARLRLKSQKSLVNSSLAGALQFCRSRNVTRQGKTRREYCRILKGLDAVWGHFCPSKPCLPLSIDGIIPRERLQWGIRGCACQNFPANFDRNDKNRP